MGYSVAASVPSLVRSAAGGGGLGVARLGALRALPEELQRFGVDVGEALQRACLPADLFADPDQRIDFAALGRLLSACTELTACEHFGLLVGARFSLADFAELGGVLRNSTTVGNALHALLVYLYIHDRLAAPLLLGRGPEAVLLGYSVLLHGRQATQLQEAAIAIAFRLLAELCGANWRPLQVQFAHAQPADIGIHLRLFGVRPNFDAGVSGIQFRRDWLDQPVPGADRELRARYAKELMHVEAGGALCFSDRVVIVLQQLLLARDCSAASVAQAFGIHPRTLRLRLSKEGRGLQSLLDQVRFELARQLLQNTHLPLAEIAFFLNYADCAVFSRAFRQWAGVSPRRWRAIHVSPLSDCI